MQEKEPTLITKILPDKVIKKTTLLQQLNHIFHNSLNTDLSSHCHIAKQTKNTIVLIVDNASWATNLRYAISDIIKTLRTQPEFRNLQKICYQIKKEFEPSKPTKTKKDPKAIQNARMLKKFAVRCQTY
jgi:hypothetical protein